jgi:hypothetical protein
MKPGATLGLSHGFLLGVMKNDNVDFRKDINVCLVAPKVCGGVIGGGGGGNNTAMWKVELFPKAVFKSSQQRSTQGVRACKVSYVGPHGVQCPLGPDIRHCLIGGHGHIR